MDSREEEDSLRNNSARANRVSFLCARFYCVPEPSRHARDLLALFIYLSLKCKTNLRIFFRILFQSSKFQIYLIKIFLLNFIKIFRKKKSEKYFSIIN